jgi:hypothetical protein
MCGAGFVVRNQRRRSQGQLPVQVPFVSARVDQLKKQEMTKTVTEGIIDILQSAGMSLHQADPLQVIDKVGYLVTGNDAYDLLYDASEIYINKKYVDPERQQRLDALVKARQLDNSLRQRIKEQEEKHDLTTHNPP